MQQLSWITRLLAYKPVNKKIKWNLIIYNACDIGMCTFHSWLAASCCTTKSVDLNIVSIGHAS